jgi:small subunit ribosomal protein S2
MKTKEIKMKQILSDLYLLSAHIGQSKDKWQNKISPYILGSKNNVLYFDTHYTEMSLLKAFAFLYKICKAKETILIVNSNIEYVPLIKEISSKSLLLDEINSINYVNLKWVGGLLTNWNQTSLSIVAYKEIESLIKKNSTFNSKNNEFFDNSIKSLLYKSPKWKKLYTSFAGIKKKPSVLIILDINKNAIALKEAILSNIPVIALVDSNCNKNDFDKITYPIMVNPQSISFIYYFLHSILKIYKAAFDNKLK